MKTDAADESIGLEVGGLVLQKETSGHGSCGDPGEPSPKDLMKTLNYRSSLCHALLICGFFEIIISIDFGLGEF